MSPHPLSSLLTFVILPLVLADKDAFSRKGIAEPGGSLNGLTGSDLLNDEVVSEQLTRFYCLSDIYITNRVDSTFAYIVRCVLNVIVYCSRCQRSYAANNFLAVKSSVRVSLHVTCLFIYGSARLMC